MCRDISRLLAPDPYGKEWPNTIAICSVMKAERAQDVKEFIDYHRYVCMFFMLVKASLATRDGIVFR